MSRMADMKPSSSWKPAARTTCKVCRLLQLSSLPTNHDRRDWYRVPVASNTGTEVFNSSQALTPGDPATACCSVSKPAPAAPP